MSSPKFAETHNVVAFLEKSKESDGFAEIIDFLKASSVSYALTINPLQALVDKKRVIVTESSIRRYLHLDDAEGTKCKYMFLILQKAKELKLKRLLALKNEKSRDIDADVKSTKTDDSTAGEAVTTAGDDNAVPTTNEEITLA
ncbi:hypothetical protein Tco_0084880 [Tanacetum coccineum]